MSQVSPSSGQSPEASKVSKTADAVAGKTDSPSGATSLHDVCHFAEGNMCRLEGKPCRRCLTAVEVVSHAEAAGRLDEEVVVSPSRDIPPRSIPPRLPSLESERIQSDLLAGRVERYLKQLREFEDEYRELLRLPLTLSTPILREQLLRLRSQFSTVESFRETHFQLHTALEAHREGSRMGVLTPAQKELLERSKETLERLSRASRFLINYFETLMRTLDRHSEAALVCLHEKSYELALRIFSGYRQTEGSPIGLQTRRTLRILSYGEGFDVVEKSLHLPLHGITELQRRAFSSLQNEIEKLILLNGAPHVIPHYFARINSRSGVLFLERAEGDFSEVIFKQGVKKTQLKVLLKGVLQGVVEAHKRHIVHNDIKLENILIEKGEAYLGDFGHAQFEGKPCIGGTKQYAPPERFEKPNETTSKSDIWSFGVLCFVALTGTFPFPESLLVRGDIFRRQSMITTHLQEGFAKERKRTRLLDPDGALQDVIFRALCLDPAHRSSAEELLRHPYFIESGEE